MLLYISDNKTVEDLQDHFNDCFPFLKIEFYKDSDNYFKEGDKSNLIKPHTLIGNVRKKSYSGILDIKSWYKTARVKQELKELFGLNVQIFRLNKDQWIPTCYSDNLTLKQQCELAQEYALLQQ